MDIITLTTFLSPFLPFLLKLGDKAAEKVTETAAEKFGEAAWAKAQAVWNSLSLKIEAKEAAKEAVVDVAKDPDDEDLQATLRVQLKKLLEQDEELAKAIAKILQADTSNNPGTQITQNVKGNQNQVIGQVGGGQVFGNITGTVIINSPTNPQQTTPNQTASPQPPTTAVKTILVLAANPKGTNPLRLGEEVRSIQNGLERSQNRDRFRIEQRWAVTATDIRRALLDCHPQIVHFCGHGVGVESAADPEPGQDARKFTVVSETNNQPEGLMFEDETGQPHLVSSEAIAQLFSLFADQIDCVLLNACYSATQADAIAEHIPFVVGMKRAIGDQAAIEFAIGFYDALLAGRDVEFAFKLGRSAIQLEGIPEHLTPILKRR